MKGEQKTIPFEEFATNLETILDQVEREGSEITVERGNAQFVVRPKHRRSSGRKARQMRRDDAMWDIVGIASSGEPGNTVASNKYPYVAEAIAAEFEQQDTQGEGRPDQVNEGHESPPTSDKTP